MKYAYCRVSTERQSLKRQIDNIAAAFPEITERNYYTEKYTGTTTNRPAWTRLLARVQPGDTIVFDSVSRMSRDAAEGAKQYEELYNKGVDLIFLNEPYCSTEAYKEAMQKAANVQTGTTGDEIGDCAMEFVRKVMMILAKKQITLAFEQAQKERDDLSKRTKDGIQAARKARIEAGEAEPFDFNRGKTLETKKAKAAKELIRRHSKDFFGTLNDTECMKLAGISRNSYYKYKSEIKAEQDTSDIDRAEADAAETA